MAKAFLFFPFYDRVLVRPIDPPKPAPGAIIVPDTAKEPPLEGEVLAVGPGRIADTGHASYQVVSQAKVGDRILFGKFAGTEITLDGEDLKIMRDEEILGRIEAHSTRSQHEFKG